MEPKDRPIRHIPIKMKRVTTAAFAFAPVPTTEGEMNRPKDRPKTAIAMVVHSCWVRRPYLSASQPEIGMKIAKPIMEIS
jgi:hypothetical protein